MNDESTTEKVTIAVMFIAFIMMIIFTPDLMR